MQSKGAQFSWNIKHVGQANIQEKMGRVWVNYSWLHSFPHSQLYLLPYFFSDHRLEEAAALFKILDASKVSNTSDSLQWQDGSVELSVSNCYSKILDFRRSFFDREVPQLNWNLGL